MNEPQTQAVAIPINPSPRPFREIKNRKKRVHFRSHNELDMILTTCSYAVGIEVIGNVRIPGHQANIRTHAIVEVFTEWFDYCFPLRYFKRSRVTTKTLWVLLSYFHGDVVELVSTLDMLVADEKLKGTPITLPMAWATKSLENHLKKLVKEKRNADKIYADLLNTEKIVEGFLVDGGDTPNQLPAKAKSKEEQEKEDRAKERAEYEKHREEEKAKERRQLEDAMPERYEKAEKTLVHSGRTFVMEEEPRVFDGPWYVWDGDVRFNYWELSSMITTENINSWNDQQQQSF